jgi:hypothetical protein
MLLWNYLIIWLVDRMIMFLHKQSDAGVVQHNYSME